jgi:hypothetical protein
MDRAAISSYRTRVQELRSALSLPGRLPDEVGHLRDELDQIVAVLRAIDAVSDVDDELGAHLLSSVTTGAVCRYTPAEGWDLEARL